MEYFQIHDADFELWVLLDEVYSLILKARQQELRQHGISVMQSRVLAVIRVIGEKATPAKISRWIVREPHSISTILGRMEKTGLVNRAKDLDRKNQVRVTLTGRGEEAYHIGSRNIESIRRMMSCLSPGERQKLKSLLQKLRHHALHELGIKHKLTLSEYDEPNKAVYVE